jgi:CBS domain-containing protein
MKIEDRLEFKNKAPVYTLAPDAMVATAIKAMSEKNYGAVVVVDKESKPVGIVTERDFMRRLLNEGRDPAKTKLSEIMTTNLKLAKGDDNLIEWLQQMSNERFRHLPVVDDHGVLINMMSQGDFVSYTWPQLINRVVEQARASFEVNPSIYAAIGAGVLFMLVIIAAIMVMT